MMHLMITRALGISVMSFAVASGIAVTFAPDAAANTNCGKSSHGATVSAGPNTSCAYALNAADTPLGKVSKVDVTNSRTGQTQTFTGASANRPRDVDDQLDDLCPGGSLMIMDPQHPGQYKLLCDSGRGVRGY